MIKKLIKNYDAIAFTGSRNMIEGQAEQIDYILDNFANEILVGCARGIDEYVRINCPRANIFKVKDYWQGNLNKAAFAVRSQAMIKSLSSKNGLLLSFPSSECPNQLKPSKSAFNGYGSGTWATAAYAIALNTKVMLWLPDDIQPPQQWNLEKYDDYGWWSSVNQSDREPNEHKQLTLGF